MIRRGCVNLILCLLVLLPGNASGQVGPFLDWLHKMSGPRLRTYGVTWRFGYNFGQQAERADISALEQSVLLSNVRPRTGFPEWKTDALNRAETCGIAALDTIGSAIARGETLFDEEYMDQQRGRINDAHDNLLQLYGSTDEALGARLMSAPCAFADSLPANPGHGVRARVGVFWGDDRHNDARDSVEVHAASLQFTGEYAFGIPIRNRKLHAGIEAGLGIWSFRVGGESFTAFSIPVHLNYYPFAECSAWLLRNMRIGAGSQTFFRVDTDKLARAEYLDARRSETVFTFFVGVDLSWSALTSAPRLGCGP